MMQPIGTTLDDPKLVQCVAERRAFVVAHGEPKTASEDGPSLPQRDVRAAGRRVAPGRNDPRREPPERPQPVRCRRSQAVPDARQPHGRRARERPARAVAQLPVAAPGGAPAQGLPRCPDRPRQSGVLRPERGPAPRVGRRLGARPGRAVPRPRRLQDRERHPRPRRRRRAARVGRRTHPGDAPDW